MHTEYAYDGCTAYCYPEKGMADRLLRVHIQSHQAFRPWLTLSYNTGTPAASHAAGSTAKRQAAVGKEASTVVGTKFSMRARMRMVQVREPMSCRQWRSSARSHAPCSHTAVAAARGRQQRRGQPGLRMGCLEDAGGEDGPECNAWLRRPQLSDAQRQAVRIERCLHQKRSIQGAARPLQDSKPADTLNPWVCVSLHAEHPAAAPAAPLDAAEPALQLTHEHLLEMVCIVSATIGGRLQGSRGRHSR